MATLFQEGVSHGLRPRGSRDVEVRYEGNWVKFSMLMQSSDLILAAAAKAGQIKFAEDYRDAVKENISNGGARFAYPPNKGRYKNRKIKYGGGSIALNWSGTMGDSIELMTSKTSKRVQVGIPEGITRPDYPYKGDLNELEVHEYANILEHGSSLRGIPARPVFRDTFRQTMGGLNGLRNYIETGIISGFATKTIRVNKRRGR